MTRINKHGLKINSKDLAALARKTKELSNGIYLVAAYNQKSGHLDWEEFVGNGSWRVEWLEGWESFCLIESPCTQQEIADIIADWFLRY